MCQVARAIALRILDPGATRELVVSTTPRYPLYRRLREPRGRSGMDPKNLAPTGVRALKRRAGSASLYRLSYSGRLRLYIVTHNR
jgi:hypothetical protein